MYRYPFSLYIHIPFCRHRCCYCDFNTYAGLNSLIPDYVSALCIEIELLARAAGERIPVHTLFFGGGTPSLLPIPELKRIFTTLEMAFDIHPETEITLEANPGTLDLPYLIELRAAGVNRLSLGMQSADLSELSLLERQHSLEDVEQAVEWARSAGFHNLNLDLIFGLPNQSLSTWQASLETALSLHPDHFSLYALTLEHGTPLQNWVGKGLVPDPDPDLAADMYEWSANRLETAGFFQYEISNWARKAENGQLLTCRHNLQYWRCHPYLGLGAGAHGYTGDVRTVNVLAPSAYIQRLFNGNQQAFPRTPATAELNTVEYRAGIGEMMMMGLRLTAEGVNSADFQERFGVTLQEMFAKEIQRSIKRGLLEWSGNGEECLRLTPAGRLLGNQVFVEFV